jgi:hypothetical protein
MSRFDLDPDFEDAVLRSAEFRDALEDLVAEAADVADLRAPYLTGTLASSVFGDVALTEDGWVGRVGATDFKAPWFEEGADGVPPRPFLRPAVEETIGPIEAAPEE